MKKINELIFACKSKKIKKTKSIETRFVSYQQAKKILILYEYNWQYKDQDIHNLCAQLTNDGKIVDYCNYDETKKTIYFSTRNENLNEPIGRFKIPSENIVAQVSKTEYDIIIDLSMNKSLPLQYVMLYTKTSFRVGCRQSCSSDLDFIVEVSQESAESGETKEQDVENKLIELTKITFQTIIHYLKTIKSKDN